MWVCVKWKLETKEATILAYFYVIQPHFEENAFLYLLDGRKLRLTEVK